MSNYTISFEHILSILYVGNSTESKENVKLLSMVCNKIKTADNPASGLAYFQYHKQLTDIFFDIVIIDSKLADGFTEQLLELNPHQKILINIEADNQDAQALIHQTKMKYFISEPLEINSLKKTISKVITENDTNNILQRTLEVSKTLDMKLSKEIQNYENRLQDMEIQLKQQEDFFASMSHEIRSPMNAIIGLSDVLKLDKTLKNNQKKLVDTIHNSSNMLLGIINDILDFSKIKSGQLTIEQTPFMLSMVLNYLADMITLKAQEKNIELVFEIDHNVQKNYVGDPLRTSQILLNLLSNAIKFTDKGSVSLSVKLLEELDDQERLQFIVQDTGIGIKKEKLSKLFQKYSQADKDTSRKYGGTGLGLTIAKQLTELMDGHIRVESEYGKGTSFFVDILMTKDKDASRRKYRLPSKDIMQKRVLIADIREHSAKSLQNLLDYFHIKSEIALSTKELLSKQNSFQPDLLFVDKFLYDSAKEELQHSPQEPVKTIIIEDWSQSLKRDEQESEETIYLRRPFNQDMVFQTLVEVYGYKEDKTTLKDDVKTLKQEIKKLKRQKILVVDDNPLNRKVIESLLSETPLEVISLEDGEEFLFKLFDSSYPFKLAFIDINMPKLSGYDVAKKVRLNSEFDNLKIFALSGDISPKDKEKAIASGMQGHLSKPIDTKIFYKTILENL